MLSLFEQIFPIILLFFLVQNYLNKFSLIFHVLMMLAVNLLRFTLKLNFDAAIAGIETDVKALDPSYAIAFKHQLIPSRD
jgi:hypothetical protein